MEFGLKTRCKKRRLLHWSEALRRIGEDGSEIPVRTEGEEIDITFA